MDCNATVVLFTKTNARVLANPTDLASFIKHKLAIIKPDLSQVKGVPPHFWKYEFGMILPMNADEQNERLRLIKEIGVDNETVITPQVVEQDMGVKLVKDLAAATVRAEESEKELKRVSEELYKANQREMEIKHKLELERSSKNFNKYVQGIVVALLVALILIMVKK